MIIDLQRRIAEVGRIRIGQQVNGTNGKRPTKLTTFRITSPNRVRVQQAARLYGGTPQEWEAPAGQQWEVVTESDALNVIVPPSDMAFSQHYELWSAGGCQRRCDGNVESISDGPCVCDPDKRECKIHTRLSVMLRDLPGLGVWRIDTSGYYAAVELQGAVEVVQMAAGAGQMLPAQLRLEQRMVKRGGKTMRFAVPVLDIEISPAQLLSGAPVAMVDGTPGTVAIEPPRQREIDGSSPLTPVPESVPEHPVASVQEQSEAKRQTRRRAQSVPSTGIKPRTAAQAKAGQGGGNDQSQGAESSSGSTGQADSGHQPPPDEPVDGETMASTKQLTKLRILLEEEGFPGTKEGRQGRLDWCASAVRRPLTSSKDLTMQECSDLIDLLEQAQAQDQQKGTK